MSWSIAFEGSPNPGDLASISGAAIRSTKVAFRERFERQHTFDYNTNPTATHRSGECSVVATVDQFASRGVQGALQRRGGGLAVDLGFTMVAVSSNSHESLQNVQAAHHPQYFRVTDAVADFELNLRSIRGLDMTPMPFNIIDSLLIPSRAAHRIADPHNFQDEPLSGLVDEGHIGADLARYVKAEQTITFNSDTHTIPKFVTPPMSTFPMIFRVSGAHCFAEVGPIPSSEADEDNFNGCLRLDFTRVGSGPVTVKIVYWHPPSP